MTANEAAIRKAHQVAEERDIAGWVNCFTDDGTFNDESIGVTYRGPKELGAPSRFTRVHSRTCIATCTHSTSSETRSLSSSRCRKRTGDRLTVAVPVVIFSRCSTRCTTILFGAYACSTHVFWFRGRYRDDLRNRGQPASALRRASSS